MGGVNFINALFVGAAAVALAPIIIHLIQRRRVQRVVFGSVRFLRKMSQKVVRRRRLTELLLILLRAAVLLLVAFAFARPFLWADTDRSGKPTMLGEGAALILIDNSYSMSAETRLADAKKKALAALKELDPRLVKVGVAEFNAQFTMCSPIGGSDADVKAAIDRIKPSAQSTDLQMAIEQANRVLASRNEQDHQVILISDFQASAWRNRRSWKLDPHTSLRVETVGGPDIPNVMVSRLAVPRLVVAGGFSQVISATLSNTGEKALDNAEVALKIGDKVVERRRVSVRPRSETPVRFGYTFTEPGDVVGCISVTSKDPMQTDNNGWFSVHVTPKVHVLIVNGDPSEEMARNDAFFIGMALNPKADEPLASPFDLKQVAPPAVKPADFKNTEAVVFANVESIPSDSVTALREFLNRGGGAVFICGAKIDPDAFNKCFGDLAPCKLWKQAIEKPGEAAILTDIDLKHEVFRPFADPHTGDFTQAQFQQFFAVNDAQAAAVLARFHHDALAANAPALLEKSVGKGRSMLFTSAMDLEWNNLCVKSVFLPFVHQVMQRLCAAESAGVRNGLVGDRLSLRLPSDAGKVELVDPKGGKKALEPNPAGEGDVGQSVVFMPDAPGIYQLNYKGGSARFAANLDALEPDLRPLETKLFVAAVSSSDAEKVAKTSAGAVIAKGPARERTEERQKIWVYLMGLALLAMAVEMIIAARVGNG